MISPKQVKIHYVRRLAQMLRKKDRSEKEEIQVNDLRRKLKLIEMKGLAK